MKKIRIGVVGGYRGTSMINYCKEAGNAEVVAICDKNPTVLDAQRDACKDYDITFYECFEILYSTTWMPLCLPTMPMSTRRLP